MDLRERIQKWFATEYERDRFRWSMGEIQGHNASMIATIQFFAQGVIERGITDPRYMLHTIELHAKLQNMMEIAKSFPNYENEWPYKWALIMGTLAEVALIAMRDLTKEQDGN